MNNLFPMTDYVFPIWTIFNTVPNWLLFLSSILYINMSFSYITILVTYMIEHTVLATALLNSSNEKYQLSWVIQRL